MRSLLVAVAALALAGCGPTAAPVAGPSTAAPTPVASPTPAVARSCGALSTDAMYAAEASYNVLATTYVKGNLPANVKAVAKPGLIKLYDMLLGLRTAYAAKNATGFCTVKEQYDNQYSVVSQELK